MSTSLLYHAWGLRGYRLQATDLAQGQIVFRLRPGPDPLRCGHCGGTRVTRAGTVVRQGSALQGPVAFHPYWRQTPNFGQAPIRTCPSRKATGASPLYAGPTKSRHGLSVRA